MAFTIKEIFVTVWILVEISLNIDASFTEFDLFALSRSTDYKNAVDLCRSYGMNLVKIVDERANQIVYNFAVLRGLGQYWIDANDIRTEGLWVYSDGNSIVYSKFAYGQPDNANNEDCVRGLFFQNGIWDDIDCNILIAAICYAEKSTRNNIEIEENRLVALGQKVDFDTAVYLCRQHGMNLIKVLNEETNQIVYNYAKKQGLGYYWIDANDMATEGLWVYSDGKKTVYNKWLPGEPNNLGNENCAHGFFYNTVFWNDINCHTLITAICYGEKATNIVTIEESQLVLLRYRETYHVGFKICKELGMNLIKIQNEETNQAVNNFVLKNPVGIFWIDANDMKTEGSWVYSDGSPIVYSKWYPGEPDNYPSQHCYFNSPHQTYSAHICYQNCACGNPPMGPFWYDFDCDWQVQVICYAEKSSPILAKIEESQLMALKEKADFNTAVNLCNELGMNLIKILNEKMNEAVYNYAEQRRLKEYWIDANDMTTEGSWVYTDGNPIVYNQWGGGEPNNLTDEDCVHGRFSFGSYWNDINCNRLMSVICYAEKLTTKIETLSPVDHKIG